ncbi:MAG: hypothetical protein GX937_01605 [Lentisphaerae bacterium]|jgi:hypothetical protein|nr:hypothetical protein [Lentisphaerota bacterium]
MPDHEKERWFCLLSLADCYHFGSLWQLREDLLKRRFFGYEATSTHRGHPGVSISRTKLNSLHDTVLMLIGSSRRRNRAFAVTGVSRNSPPGKKTFFQTLRPVSVLPEHFFPPDGAASEVERNDYKPHLTETEKADLKKMLLEKGEQR